MTSQGIAVLIALALALLLWIVDLVRRERLYVGYGVVLIVAIVAVILVVVLPPALSLVTWMVGAVVPASALTLLALVFLFFMLVYILTQVTIVSNRLAALIQELAIQRAKERRQT
jgi:hypothetical protein